jgi:RHS repeat-associated protein
MHGQQIAEFDGANGNLKKEYIYGASGLVAIVEPAAVNAKGTRYTTADHLGSPRVVTNSSAAVISRHDYKPFGEELGAGTGDRTTGMGFPGSSDGLRQKFTSKERDNETGLDYFDARYFASSQGRFTSTDPLQASARPSTPQTWDRYSYVVNNPLNLVDPTGLADDDPQKNKEEQPRQPPPSQPEVVDLRKDKTINAELDKIRAGAKPLPDDTKPELTDVKTIIGDTSNINNGGYIDGYGNEATGFTGTVRPVAYVPLDQGGNIIEGNGIAAAENVKVEQGDQAQVTRDLAPTPKGGVFIDVQSAKAGSQTTVLKQAVFVGQFPPTPNTPATHLFRVGVNDITKDPKAGTISIKIGPTTKLR